MDNSQNNEAQCYHDKAAKSMKKHLVAAECHLAAMVDFAFNLGAGRLQTSTMRRRINQMDWACAALKLCKWVHGGGRVLPGLVERRQAETALMVQ